jgi:hypothetical protein
MTCSFCGTKNNIAATEFFSDGDSFMTLYSCHACGYYGIVDKLETRRLKLEKIKERI